MSGGTGSDNEAGAPRNPPGGDVAALVARAATGDVRAWDELVGR